MSRKWEEAKKPCRCIDCEGFCPNDACITENHPVSEPEKWRYCASFADKRSRLTGRNA